MPPRFSQSHALDVESAGDLTVSLIGLSYLLHHVAGVHLQSGSLYHCHKFRRLISPEDLQSLALPTTLLSLGMAHQIPTARARLVRSHQGILAEDHLHSDSEDESHLKASVKPLVAEGAALLATYNRNMSIFGSHFTGTRDASQAFPNHFFNVYGEVLARYTARSPRCTPQLMEAVLEATGNELLDRDQRGSQTKEEFEAAIAAGEWVPLRRTHLYELARDYDGDSSRLRCEEQLRETLHPDSALFHQGCALTICGVYQLPAPVPGELYSAGTTPTKTRRLNTRNGSEHVMRDGAEPVIDFV